MVGGARKFAIDRRWFIALAAIALAVQFLVPQGYMVSQDRGAPGLVICTGHGSLRLSDSHHIPGKAPKSSDAPCAFAAHGIATPPPLVASLVIQSFEYVGRAATPAFDLAPGRGLAAPPPQSHAPPTILI